MWRFKKTIDETKDEYEPSRNLEEPLGNVPEPVIEETEEEKDPKDESMKVKRKGMFSGLFNRGKKEQPTEDNNDDLEEELKEETVEEFTTVPEEQKLSEDGQLPGTEEKPKQRLFGRLIRAFSRDENEKKEENETQEEETQEEENKEEQDEENKEEPKSKTKQSRNFIPFWSKPKKKETKPMNEDEEKKEEEVVEKEEEVQEEEVVEKEDNKYWNMYLENPTEETNEKTGETEKPNGETTETEEKEETKEEPNQKTKKGGWSLRNFIGRTKQTKTTEAEEDEVTDEEKKETDEKEENEVTDEKEEPTTEVGIEETLDAIEKQRNFESFKQVVDEKSKKSFDGFIGEPKYDDDDKEEEKEEEDDDDKEKDDKEKEEEDDNELTPFPPVGLKDIEAQSPKSQDPEAMVPQQPLSHSDDEKDNENESTGSGVNNFLAANAKEVEPTNDDDENENENDDDKSHKSANSEKSAINAFLKSQNENKDEVIKDNDEVKEPATEIVNDGWGVDPIVEQTPVLDQLEEKFLPPEEKDEDNESVKSGVDNKSDDGKDNPLAALEAALNTEEEKTTEEKDDNNSIVSKEDNKEPEETNDLTTFGSVITGLVAEDFLNDKEEKPKEELKEEPKEEEPKETDELGGATTLQDVEAGLLKTEENEDKENEDKENEDKDKDPFAQFENTQTEEIENELEKTEPLNEDGNGGGETVETETSEEEKKLNDEEETKSLSANDDVKSVVDENEKIPEELLGAIMAGQERTEEEMSESEEPKPTETESVKETNDDDNEVKNEDELKQGASVVETDEEKGPEALFDAFKESQEEPKPTENESVKDDESDNEDGPKSDDDEIETDGEAVRPTETETPTETPEQPGMIRRAFDGVLSLCRPSSSPVATQNDDVKSIESGYEEVDVVEKDGQKVYKLEDSNMENYGSQAHIDAAKKAYGTDSMFHDDLRSEVGLTVWRVHNRRKNFGIYKVPEHKYGEFYSGDSYVVLNTYVKNNEEKFHYDIHFWLGSDSSQDEEGVAAVKSVELDTLLDDAAIQHREVEYFESPKFQSYFKRTGIKHLKGGHKSGFRHVEERFHNFEPVLYMVKQRKRACHYYQVEPKVKNMNQGDVFVLDLGSKVFTWYGESASPFEKFHGCSLVNTIVASRAGKATKCTITNEEFWNTLGGKEEDVQEAVSDEVGDDFYAGLNVVNTKEEAYAPEKTEMYRITDVSGKIEFVQVEDVSEDKLTTDDVYLVSSNVGVWIWHGLKASKQESTAAFGIAKGFIKEQGFSNHLPITVMREGQVDSLLTSVLYVDDNEPIF